MTDQTPQTQDAALEDLFQQTRATPPEVPAALMTKVLADAERLQPVRKGRIWHVLWQAWGGAAGAGGLITATLVGVWLGVAPPAAMPDFAGALVLSDWESDASEESPYLTGFGWDFEEG